MKKKYFVYSFLLCILFHSHSLAQNLQFNRVINYPIEHLQEIQGIVPANQVYKIVSVGIRNYGYGSVSLNLDTLGGTNFTSSIDIISWNYTGTIASEYYRNSVSFPFWIASNTGYKFKNWTANTVDCYISIIVYDIVP